MEYLAIADRHSGMLSVHCTKHKGANEVIRILREHCQLQGIPQIIFTDGSSIFCAQEMKDFFKRFDIEHRISSVSNLHANLRSEGSVKSLKRMLRDIVGNSGSLDSDAVTEALLCHAKTRCRVLNKSPAEIAYGRCLKAFFPRQVSSLLPIPDNLLSWEAKDKLQKKIRAEGDKRWSEHTRVLPGLKIGQFVQFQNLKGGHLLKSNYNGEIVGRHNINSYAVKVNGTGKTTMRNRASLRKIPQPIPVHQPLNFQGPGMSSEPSADVTAGQPGAARGLLGTRELGAVRGLLQLLAWLPGGQVWGLVLSLDRAMLDQSLMQVL